VARPTWDSLREWKGAVPLNEPLQWFELGSALRDAGMARASAAEDPEWRACALRVIEMRRRGGLVKADDVRDFCGDPFRPNSMGAVFRTAAMRGWIAQADYRKSERKERHASRQLVWVRL
jgi:hypothetical protein